VAGGPKRLPDLAEPPLRRENRLYQADWLLRLYGYTIDEVIDSSTPWLDLTMDPKQAYAQRHPELFPVDINTADREMILKVPGIGLKSANRIVNLRQQGRIRVEHLHQLGAIVSRARPFIRCDGLPTTHWSSTPLPLGPRQKALPRSLETRAPASSGRVFETDGSFEGLLCAIFEAYKSRRPPTAIVPRGRAQQGLFDRHVAISTDPVIADRVWKRLKTHLGAKRRRRVYDAYLSDLDGVETTIFQMISQAIDARTGTGAGSRLSAFIQIDTISRKVRREAHRMKGLVRFQQTGDDRYLALIAPRYDILPLIRRHFESRYGDQLWIIYDTQRDYGLGYDGNQTHAMQLDRATLAAASDTGVNAKEALCRLLWQRYFAAVNLQQRNNLKRHVSQLPRRYWRYLPEKQL
jgi:probable DNA metabolism protein